MSNYPSDFFTLRSEKTFNSMKVLCDEKKSLG